MKKILFALSAALVLFSACSKEENKTTPKVNFTLTNDNIEIADLTATPLVVVDAASKTVAIEIAYADKDMLKALEVNFVGIPSDVTVENFSFDFSAGATKEVAVSQGKATDTYVFSASAAAPQPKFLTMSLAPATVVEGEDPVLGEAATVAGGVAKLKGSANLASLACNFTVSPEGTQVFIGEETVESGAILDFSDKVNGVTFTLKCEDVTVTETVKVVTTGFSSFTRVWGHYAKPVSVDASAIYGAENQLPVAGGHWDRNIALDNNYVYIPHFGGTKVYALNIADGSFAKVLDNTGIEGGFSTTTAARVIDNGASSILLVSNMVGAGGNGDPLRVYAYDNADAAPRKVLEYAQSGQRLGDKFTVEGDWQEGKLYFYSMSSSSVYVFSINAGTIDAEPDVIALDTKPGAYVGAYSKFSASEYVWAGAGTLPKVYNADGAMTYNVTDGARFTIPTHDMTFFTFMEQNYMTYINLENSYQDGAVNIREVNYNTIAETLDVVATGNKMTLGDPDNTVVTALKNGNGVGGCAVREIDGELFIAAIVPGAGISLFKLKN